MRSRSPCAARTSPAHPREARGAALQLGDAHDVVERHPEREIARRLAGGRECRWRRPDRRHVRRRARGRGARGTARRNGRSWYSSTRAWPRRQHRVGLGGELAQPRRQRRRRARRGSSARRRRVAARSAARSASNAAREAAQARVGALVRRRGSSRSTGLARERQHAARRDRAEQHRADHRAARCASSRMSSSGACAAVRAHDLRAARRPTRGRRPAASSRRS